MTGAHHLKDKQQLKDTSGTTYQVDQKDTFMKDYHSSKKQLKDTSGATYREDQKDTSMSDYHSSKENLNH